MSKASRTRRKKERDKAKSARKLANYLRCGPKAGGNLKKKYKLVGDGKTAQLPLTKPVKTSAKGRRRRRRNGLQWTIKRKGKR